MGWPCFLKLIKKHYGTNLLIVKNSTNFDSIKNYTYWIGRFEFQNKFCNLSLVLRDRLHLALFKKIWWHNSCHTLKHHSYFKEIWATLWSSQNLVEIIVTLYYVARVMWPDFLKKCQMQPISQDQWQIAKFILKFKSTQPTGIIFDGIRIGWIFSLLKDLFHNVGYWPHEELWWGFFQKFNHMVNARANLILR